jgi:RNA methyltransferase, TrmH family
VGSTGRPGESGAGLSAQSERVQRLRRLIGRRESRSDEGVVVVEGPNALSEALVAGVRVREVYLDGGAADLSPSVRSVVEGAVAGGAQVVVLAPGVMAKVADTVTPQAVVAVVDSPSRSVAEVFAEAVGSDGFVVICVDVRDPGNAGTIIRSAEAAGAAGVVMCKGCVDATSPKVVRSTAGALFHVPVAGDGGPPEAVFAHATSVGIRLIGTSADHVNARTLDEISLLGPVALVVSNEAHGLSAEREGAVGEFVTIPMAGRTESLNVAMATTVLVFEAARQRRLLKAHSP